MTETTSSSTSSPPSGKRRSRGWRVIKWVESHCVHTNGEWIGRPFRLLAWQKRLILELFEVGEDDLRRYRWALIGVPKKNGKTELAAALALYLLIADGEPSPLVVCAAASDEQADLVFGAAKTMCEMSPTLSQITECYEKEILVPSIPGARLKRVAAVAGTNDGQNIHAVVCDELHEWTGDKGRKVWTVLTNGLGARRQPMVLQITTAGYDVDGTVCGEQYRYGKRVRSGEVDDPRYYFCWYEAPEGCDHRDPAVWEAANPSYGVLVHASFFEDQLSKKDEATFRRYFLDQWTSGSELWLPFGAWDACLAPDRDLDPTSPLRVGIDVSKNRDATAVVAAQRQGERVVVRAKVWANPYLEGHSLHDGWRVNNNWIKEYCRELFARFPVPACKIDDEVMPGPEFAYDPWHFGEAAQELAGEGLALVEFPQTDARMIPASQALYELVVKGRIAHDGDPTLRQHVSNVTPDVKPRGSRISKPKGSKRHIDAAVAAAIAAYRALEPSPDEEQSVYEERGVIVV